ncbi:hypothetical protein IOC61_01080 [Halomonas sp. KAO]|uniref:hypothetical protein n=2 Tax=Halomonas TaxID=2745 RepID=UPI00189EBACD|nr:hypothetical protein [Halomonas sp. KAO]MBF7051910.1 hypothetical protein [Halomonas sp. KAO]
MPSRSTLRWVNVIDRMTSTEWRKEDKGTTMTISAGSQHRARGGRLLALLLAVLLSVSGLVAQAAMDSCAADCSTAEVEMFDFAASDCAGCVAMPALPLIFPPPPDTLADTDGAAVVEFIAPPPREPPRP